MERFSNAMSMRAPIAESQDIEQIPAREVVALLFDTSRVLCVQSDRLLGESIGLSEARARLLVTVSETEPARMGKLAADLGVSARSVTGMVDALERQGLLVRQSDPQDRRATLLRLTEDSRARMSQLNAAQHELAENLLAVLDDGARTHLYETLTALRSNAAPE